MPTDWGIPPVTPSLAGLTVDAEDISFTLEEVATATTLTINHFLVLVNTTGGDITITLPASASHAERVYTIKNIGTGKVTIDANGSEKIDDEETIVLNLQYSYVTIVCDGTEWFIIGGGNVKLETLLETQVSKQKETAQLLEKLLRASRLTNRYFEKEWGGNLTEKDVDIS